MIEITKKSGITMLECTDGKERIGYILFAREEILEIVDLVIFEEKNSFLADGLLRAALNSGRLEGIKEAFSKNMSIEKYLKALGFTLCDGELFVKIEDVLKKCCGR